MKPDKSGILVSVEKWGDSKQYQMLRAIPVNSGYDLYSFAWILEFCISNSTSLAYKLPNDASFRYIGCLEFLEYFENPR